MTATLEPEAAQISRDIHTAAGGDAVQGIAMVSIALSMKRIADEVESGPEKFGLVQGIMEAIEMGLFKASQR